MSAPRLIVSPFPHSRLSFGVVVVASAMIFFSLSALCKCALEKCQLSWRKKKRQTTIAAECFERVYLSRNSDPRPRKMKKPPLSVTPVANTEEPLAGSRPCFFRVKGM